MKEVTTRQFIIIAIIVMLTSKFVTMPSIIFAAASKDAIFSIIIGISIELLLIFLITCVIKKNQDTNLFQLLKKKFSKFGAYIILFILFVYIFARLLFSFQELYSFFTELLYDEFSPIIFAVPTFFVTGYLAYKGARTIGRTYEIILPFIIFGIVIALVSNFEFLKFDTNLPYFENGFLPVLQGLGEGAFYFGNSICLLFFVGKVKITKSNFISKTMITLGVTALIIVCVCFIFYDVFGMSMYYTYFALTEYSQYDPFILELQRLVWLSAIVDIVKLFCSTVTFVYCLGQIFKPIMQTKTTLLPIIISFLLIFSLATLLHYDVKICFEIIRNYASFITLGIIAFCMILSVILCIKKKAETEIKHFKFKRRENDKKFI